MLFVDSSVGIILSYERNWLSLLLGKRKHDFWSEVKRLNKAPVVDGNSDCKDIAALFASNFSNLLNRHDVLEALSQMKPNKCDI